jgi:hypothetical protein
MVPGEKYLTSIYFTVQTITTVGYGDGNIETLSDKIFCTMTMLIGVFAFSFASGSLATILLEFDNQSGKLKQHMSILNSVHKEYKIPILLYQNLKNSLNH